ncbi:MAG: ABC transporter substrate-binding protein [bacterium]|nr:ABC transporter substrate-binding protein [bacterium]
MLKYYFLILWLLGFGCAKKPVKIGVVLPISGPLSSYGDMCLKGVQLGANIINTHGGINGRQVELIVEDDKGEDEAAYLAVDKLHKQGVLCIIGPLTTKNVIRIGEYADKSRIPIITPTATGIKATEGRDWVWRISFTDPFQGVMLAKFAIENLKAKSTCIFLDPRDPYSAGLCESFELEFSRLGGKILSKHTFEASDTIFETQLKSVKAANPACVFIPAFYSEASLITRQARDIGIKVPFIGGDGWDSPELSRIIGNRPGVNYYSTHFFYNYGAPEVQEFLHQFRLEYSIEPETFSALGYDAIRLIQEIFKRSRRVTRSNFQYNIKSTSFLGATGTIDFTKGREPRRSLMIIKFEPGKPIEMVTTY